MKLTGAQIMMKVLKEEGVETIFGYPGGVVIDIYDELDKTDIQHVIQNPRMVWIQNKIISDGAGRITDVYTYYTAESQNPV